MAASDQNDHLASFSNYGATTVDIAAPGTSIYSTIPGNKYAIYSGTSMAAPFVSGVAALAWAVDPNASVANVRNAILQGADRVAGLSGKVACGGRLDAYNTLQLISRLVQQPPSNTVPTTTPSGNHGNSAATATTVAVPSLTQGMVSKAGDLDWFSFQATAGRTYVVSTQLGTLRHSVLRLYDHNGAKQLAFNDNIGPGNLAWRIRWDRARQRNVLPRRQRLWQHPYRNLWAQRPAPRRRCRGRVAGTDDALRSRAGVAGRELLWWRPEAGRLRHARRNMAAARLRSRRRRTARLPTWPRMTSRLSTAAGWPRRWMAR